jgi:hypothetical protein
MNTKNTRKNTYKKVGGTGYLLKDFWEVAFCKMYLLRIKVLSYALFTTKLSRKNTFKKVGGTGYLLKDFWEVAFCKMYLLYT